MSLTSDQKVVLFRNLARAMALDRMMMRVIRAGKMVGFYHEGGIALAPGIAAGAFLKKEDAMWPHYRAHGLAHMLGKGIDIKYYVAEHMGREAGCCKGRSSFHMSFPEDHVFGFSGNIGANFPLSVGYGFAAKYKQSGQIVMNCSGDGSYGEGRCHEALLMSANWKLPVVFWCEANGMAQHSNVKDLFPGPNVSSLAAGFGIPSMIVDGQDLFACAEAALQALAHVRQGSGPIFVECKTYRVQEHSVGGVNYEGPNQRDPELMAKWKETLNPLALAAARLLAEKALTQEDIDQIKADAEREADEVEAFCEASPKALPSVAEMQAAVYTA
ncbi:thiamine pyrophosphate-dependent dehydrogenase E1 component subunit alpha [Thauera sp. SDU_THAU2]|uniref:thiamine pyrophosphate-dependent dehydrogenase E1 component subunit alpha n=1 Tax=Thauera sp. SDU_THAU2 TaxID=3136633 RepID=UPI00311EF8A4